MSKQDISPYHDTDGRAPDPWTIMRRLYQSEINSALITDSASHITVTVGGAPSGSGPRAQASFSASEFDKIAAWMDFEAAGCIQTAITHDPNR